MAVKPLDKLFTVDDLLALPDDDKRYELHDGELVELGTSSRKHTRLGAWIIRMLYNHDTSVPDAAYVSAAKGATLPSGTVYYPFAPDLAVEIKSPSNSKRKMQRLATMYLNAGAQLVWIIDPEALIVTVYRTGGMRFEVNIDGELDGYDVLPGLKLNMAEMFKVIEGL